MLVNIELDNTIEGTYFQIVEQVSATDYRLNALPDVVVNNIDDWLIGWGNGKPLLDAGFENIARIRGIDSARSIVSLGETATYPKIGTEVVFWNSQPSGFSQYQKTPLFNPQEMYNEFTGTSVGFGGIFFDSVCGTWYMLNHEADYYPKSWYLAASKDLKNWEALNRGKAIVRPTHSTVNGQIFSTDVLQASVPAASSVVKVNGGWVIFSQGYDENGNGRIFKSTTAHPCEENWPVDFEKVQLPGEIGVDIHSPEVVSIGSNYLIFYTCKYSDGSETLRLAQSSNLYEWDELPTSPILNSRTGWASASINAECVWSNFSDDTLYALIAGAKDLKMGWYHHYITGRMYLDRKGNPYKTQLGLYFSPDTGKTWYAHSNNPVWSCDYSNEWQADHMGGDFAFIEMDTMNYLFTQAKGRNTPYRVYSIFLNIR